MGAFHPDHATHNSLVHELHVATEEDTGCTRDSHLYICWSVQPTLPWLAQKLDSATQVCWWA